MKEMYQDPYDKKITNEGEGPVSGHDWKNITKSPYWPLWLSINFFLVAGLILLLMWIFLPKS